MYLPATIPTIPDEVLRAAKTLHNFAVMHGIENERWQLCGICSGQYAHDLLDAYAEISLLEAHIIAADEKFDADSDHATCLERMLDSLQRIVQERNELRTVS